MHLNLRFINLYIYIYIYIYILWPYGVSSCYDAYNQSNRNNCEFQIKSYVAEKNDSNNLKPYPRSVSNIQGNRILNNALNIWYKQNGIRYTIKVA
jgi:hypothetical protein